MVTLKNGNKKVRDVSLDILKGIGVLLVVIGHNITDQAFIFCFHMPLFFLISGFLFSPKDRGIYLKKSIRRLLIPYLCFLFIISLPELLSTVAYGNLKEGLSFIAKLLYGGENLKGVYAVFWYITVLWVATNLFNLILHFNVKLYILPIIILSAYLTCFIPYPLPWNIQIVPMAIVYLWIGYILKQRVVQFKYLFSTNKIFFCFLAIAFLVGIYLCRENLTIDMKYNRMGIPILSLVSSVVASASVVILAVLFIRWNPMVKGIVFIGEASMVIMYLHMPIKYYLESHLSVSYVEVINILLGIGVSLVAYSILKNNRLGRKFFLGSF